MNHLSPQFVLELIAFLCAAISAGFDLAVRRIPNLLTGPVMIAGLGLHLAAGGWRELLTSAAGLLLCGSVFLMFYLAGGMGAGDVKLIAAEGCVLGLANSVALLTLTALAGGVLAIFYALLYGRLKQTCVNMLDLVDHHRKRGLTPHPDLNVLNAETLRLPYGLAIAS